MPTVAEAFSGENNILPLDGRGLAKHHQPGDSAQCCHHYQLTPAPPPPRDMQKMVRSTVLQEEQETHHYSFTRPKVPSCRTFVGLRDPMFEYSCRKKERKKRDGGGVGGGCSAEIGYLLLGKQKGIKCPTLQANCTAFDTLWQYAKWCRRRGAVIVLSSAELALQHARALASGLRAQQVALSRAVPLNATFCSAQCAKISCPAPESDLWIQM